MKKLIAIKTFLLCITLVMPLTSFSNTTINTNVCQNFHPGMEFRVFDSVDRTIDGYYHLKMNLLQDVHNFNGVLLQIDWGTIESTPGIYDWSRLDKILLTAQKAGKYLRVRIEDRTFWTGCASKSFLPSDIAREAGALSPNNCYAKIWEKDTMDRYIAVVTAMLTRYSSNPYFTGVVMEETALDSASIYNNKSLYQTALYPQLIRLAAAAHAAAPYVLFTQYINWPYKSNSAYFSPIVSNLLSTNGGIGWPDSRIDQEFNYSWYQLARNNNSSLLIAPSAESGSTSSATTIADALVDHEATYEMLVKDTNAHIIVWDTDNVAFGSNYFSQVVIPTVNNHNGAVLNNTCPFK